MGLLQRALQAIINLFGGKLAGKINQWRGAREVSRAARRYEDAIRPSAYKPITERTDLDLPDITPADYQYEQTQYMYDELREYRDQLTELLTSFDFPPDVIEQISNIDLEQLEGADFTRLNGALDRLERYRLAYEGGYITSDDFDYDYIINELNSSIPNLNVKMPGNFNVSPFERVSVQGVAFDIGLN